MRSLIFAALIGLVANLASAEVAPEQAALIDKVVAAFKENDSRLGAVKARMKMVYERSPDVRSVQTPPPVAPPPRLIGGPVDSRSVLIVHEPTKSIEWTVEVFGEIQRFSIAQWFGKEIISADAKGVTVYRPEENQAWIMSWGGQGIGSNLQYDPRDLGFLTMDENLLRLHRLGRFESAKRIDREKQETIIELRAKSLMDRMSLVIECSSRFGYLPTRIYYIFDNDRVTSVTDMSYQQVRVDSTPAWFLKSAVKRNAVVHNNKSPDDKKWGQVMRTTVTDLELDKLPPPRDDELSLPEGTSIQRRL